MKLLNAQKQLKFISVTIYSSKVSYIMIHASFILAYSLLL